MTFAEALALVVCLGRAPTCAADARTYAVTVEETAGAYGHQWTLDGYEARCARCDMELVAVVTRVGRTLTSEIRVAGRAGEVFNPRKHRCSP